MPFTDRQTAETGLATRPKPAPKYIPTQPAADYLGLAKRTLEGLRVRGGGPEFFKLGRRAMYSYDALDAWAESRRRTSTSDTGEAA